MSATKELREARLAARNALERAGKLPFKSVTTAKWVDVQRTWSGKVRACIEHDTIRGCTPQMMRWWFENLGRTTTWDGVGFEGPEISFYHLWHHRDHIAIVPVTGSTTGFVEGGFTRVMEQFNDFHETINSNSMTKRLDNEEFTFTVMLAGVISVCQVIHYYSSTPMGLRFYAETVAGSDIPILGWIFNWCILPFIFSRATGERWIRHNIEETGRSEDIVPILYEHYRNERGEK